MHISLTGNLGSGKSTVCKILEGVYGYEIYHTGCVQRELAAERGISVLEMNDIMRKDPSYDRLIDEHTTQKSIEAKGQDIVFDSRLAWHFAVDTFKVFMSVSLDEAAKRVFNDSKRGEVEKYSSVEEAKKYLKDRADKEDVRYHEIYNIDYFNFDNYDMIIDSTYCTPGLIARLIVEEAHNYYEDRAKGIVPEKKVLFSPRRFGFGSTRNANAPGFYSNESVKIAKQDGDYVIVSGEQAVREAASEGFLFINAKLI